MPDAETLLNIRGEKVALGPLRRDLLPHYQRWINDFEATRYLSLPGSRPMSSAAEEAWLDHAVADGSAVHFTIYELASLRPIGNTALTEIDHRNGAALFGIFIGEKDCWNRGYGTETTRLMLAYGFDTLGLHNIMLLVNSENRWAIQAYLRAGFREMGRRRESRMNGRRRTDDVYMDCLAPDFEATR